MNEPKYAIATEMRKRDGAQNQDCGAAERLLMADGNFAYIAALADGVSCCDHPREAASLAISHFRRAIEGSSLQELSDAAMRARWLESWTAALDEEVERRARDGYATFCALAVMPLPGETGYGVLSLNVGDSSSFMVTPQDSRCISMKPDDGGSRHSGDDGLLRGVGLSHRGFPLIDCDFREFPAGFSGYFWVGCDGVFNYVMGSDLRDLCTGGRYAFRELPQVALSMSMAEGRRQAKKTMDNATAAVIGVNVPEAATVAPPADNAVPPQGRKFRCREWPRRMGAKLARIPARTWVAVALLALALAAALKLAMGRSAANIDAVPPAPQQGAEIVKQNLVSTSVATNPETNAVTTPLSSDLSSPRQEAENLKSDAQPAQPQPEAGSVDGAAQHGQIHEAAGKKPGSSSEKRDPVQEDKIREMAASLEPSTNATPPAAATGE